MRNPYAVALILCALLAPAAVSAEATLIPDTMTIELARVTSISDETTRMIPGTETPQHIQTLTATILSGDHTGTSVTFQNDYVQLTAGERFYLRHTENPFDGMDYYSVSDPYRLDVLGILAIAFLAIVFVFGGIQGMRGLAALAGSIVLISYALVPGILHGYDPVLVSTGVAFIIITIGSYVTHGWNRTTSAAVLGMIATVALTGIGAYIAVHAAHLTGYATEENVYLNFNTRGMLDMQGLLFGGIMIGLLGVLYDIAIGQAVAVEELCASGAHFSRTHIYTRGIRIGREHIGALINTLAIAYVGAALPLLLLVQETTYGFVYVLNSELFATEIVRIIIGSSGIILAVPITTMIAVRMLHGRERSAPRREGEGHHH